MHINKELELALKIYIILANKLKKKIQENFEQVKILWNKQINLTTITSTNNVILDKYQDFTKLFIDKTLEETLLAY